MVRGRLKTDKCQTDTRRSHSRNDYYRENRNEYYDSNVPAGTFFTRNEYYATPVLDPPLRLVVRTKFVSIKSDTLYYRSVILFTIHLPSKLKIYNETIIKRKLVSLLIYTVIQPAGRKKCTDLENQQMERLIELERERLIAEKRKATALERIAEALEAKMKKWYV